MSAHGYAEIERSLFLARQLETVVLRFGFLYGPGTWFSPEQSIADQVRAETFPIIDGGHGVWSFIHIEDAAESIVSALRCSPGIYNIVDDQPSEVSIWLPGYARWLGAKFPKTISIGEAATSKGADAVYYATRLRGASNAKAKQHLGFNPRTLEWLAEAKLARAM
jgi:nucleoside-diphosphate-sugar epimerase